MHIRWVLLHILLEFVTANAIVGNLTNTKVNGTDTDEEGDEEEEVESIEYYDKRTFIVSRIGDELTTELYFLLLMNSPLTRKID